MMLEAVINSPRNDNFYIDEVQENIYLCSSDKHLIPIAIGTGCLDFSLDA